jgi:hypothetical protein
MGVELMNRNEINKALANVAATLRVENLKPSKEAQKISSDYLNGKLNSDEAIDKIKTLYGF